MHVAVGVIISPDDRVLIAKRASHQHQGGLWEFPGGKLEAGESVAAALCRELSEELDLLVDQRLLKPLMQVSHDYPDKSVVLDVWWVPCAAELMASARVL